MPLSESELILHETKLLMLEMLTGDLFFHHRIKEVLTAAGFDVLRVTRFDHHDLWELKLRIRDFDLSLEPQTAARQIRRVLKKGKLPIDRDAICIRQYRDRVTCAFNFEFGAVDNTRLMNETDTPAACIVERAVSFISRI
jgi:hypothetical protein